jgi:hypothetical protein
MKIKIFGALCMTASLSYAQSDSESPKQSYLCIVEKGSEVTKDEALNLEAKSYSYDKRYLVTPQDGLKEFGKDDPLLAQCNYDEKGRPFLCEYPGENWAGNFIMDENLIFVLSGVFSDGNAVGFHWYIGRCSSL